MNSNSSNTNNTLVAAQLPPFQVLPMPQVNFMLPQVTPQQILPPYQLVNNVPVGTPLKQWDFVAQQVIDLPTNFVPVMNNFYIPPQGFSFVLMDIPQTTQSVSDSGSVSQSVERSVSLETDSYLSRPPTHSVSRQATPEPADQPRKYKHRSKQERIEQVHAEVKAKYTALNLYAREDEVLRGFDTVRVHVKTYRGLNVINQPLDMIMESPYVQVLKIATPFSMKNKFQKKGFIVYLKLASEDQVEIVQGIFKQFEEYFPKCDIALKKEDKQRLDEQKRKEEEARLAEEMNKAPVFKSTACFDKVDDWADVEFFCPPPMKKQSSLSSIAA